MKNEKFLIFFIILALFIGSVNAEDVDLEDSHIENETYVNDTVLNEKNQYENIDENESHVCSDDDLNSLELNTSGVVMSDNEYSCGAASFATVLNKMGINISLNESKDATKTTINGTTMNNIIYAAKTYNLIAYAINTNTANLKENFIVHMDIMGINHLSVVKEINNETIILADPNLGNFKYDLCEFNQYYTNQSVIITKSTINNIINNVIPIESNFISEVCQKYISGKGYVYYVSETMGKIPDKPKGPVIRFTIIVPKWGGKTIKLSTTKLTKHKISTKVIYTIKVYSKNNFKGKVETLYQPAFFNFAHKSGHNYSLTRKASFPIHSIKWNVKMSPFPYS